MLLFATSGEKKKRNWNGFSDGILKLDFFVSVFSMI